MNKVPTQHRSQRENAEPQLDKPGAGIPFFELAVARYILMPLRFLSTSQQQALKDIENDTREILALVEKLSPQQMVERRLIPRLAGLEDSSRYWSVAMTLEHIVIVNESIRAAVISLCAGRKLEKKASTADVKPERGVQPETIISRFKQTSEIFLNSLANCKTENSKEKYEHPWFGPLSAEQWIVFVSPHLQIHKQQIKEIIKRI